MLPLGTPVILLSKVTQHVARIARRTEINPAGGTGSGLRAFLSELKRRHVYRVAAVYAAVAFVILEAASFIFPALLLPDWSFRLLVFSALFGFPIALILAWALQLTPEGVRRSEPSEPAWRRPSGRLLAGTALSGVTALAVFVAYWAYLRPEVGVDLVADRVAVAPLENLSGDPDLDPIGQMAADWIIQGLSQTSLVEVVPSIGALVSSRNVQEMAGPLEAMAWVRAFAEETGAGLVVAGAHYLQGDSIFLQARVTDARQGKVLRALGPVSGPAAEPLRGVEGLRDQAMAGLASHLDPRLAVAARVSSQPPSYDAYREYIAGLEAHVLHQFREALDHLYRAAAFDSTFTVPLLFAAAAHTNLGEYALADSIVEMLTRSEARLAPLDRALLDWLRADVQGDLPGALQAARRMAEIAPGSFRGYQVGLEALLVNRPREAVNALTPLDPTRGQLRGWMDYWTVLAAAYHMLGDHRRELEAARRAGRQYPGRLEPLEMEVRALAATGRVDEVRQRVDDSLRQPFGRGISPAGIMQAAGVELRAHGYPDAAREMFERTVTWHKERPLVEMRTRGYRHGLANALYLAGQWHEAQVAFQDLAADDPENVFYQGFLGVLAARHGDRREAQRISEELGSLQQPYLFGENTYWRACIAALLGERHAAVALLREAFASGYPYSLVLHTDVDLESLRDYPPFQELLRPRG